MTDNARSVIEIDVNDQAFKDFQALFERYRSQVKTVPKDWQDVGKSAQTAARGIQDASTGTASLKQQVSSAAGAMESLSRHTGTVAADISKATFQLSKWSAFGLLSAGATLASGAVALANAGASQRREAGGYGVTTGQLNAAKINYGPYANVEGIIGALGNAQLDQAQWGKLASAGFTDADRTRSPADLIGKFLEAGARTLKQGGTQQFNALGFADLGLSVEDARRVGSLPAGELAGREAGYAADARKFTIDPASLRALTDLTVQLKETATTMETWATKLVAGLAPSVTAAIKDPAATALDAGQNADSWLAKNFPNFYKYDRMVGQGMVDAGSGAIKGAQNVRQRFSTLGMQKGYLSTLEQQYGLPAGALDSIWAAESSRGRDMLSPAGAKGHFGFMDATAAEYGLKDPNNFAESASAAARKVRALLKEYGGNIRESLAAYNWGDGHLNADIAKYGKDWESHLPSATRDYLARTTITIHDATGGNLNVIANQVAQ